MGTSSTYNARTVTMAVMAIAERPLKSLAEEDRDTLPIKNQPCLALATRYEANAKIGTRRRTRNVVLTNVVVLSS